MQVSDEILGEDTVTIKNEIISPYELEELEAY